MFGTPLTGPIICSTLLFKNPDELRQSLNEQFRESHPQVKMTKI